MNASYYIRSFCIIKQGHVFLNEAIVFQNNSSLFQEFAKAAYKNLEMNYSKFFKMDNLSKLAVLTADYLFRKEGISEVTPSNIALVLANRASSLDTDRKHQASIQDKETYYPSPAVFVYTLPNICLGEISIKYKLYTENSFFIFDNFQPQELMVYTKGLLDNNKADHVLCGWVDFDGEAYESFLYLVSKEGSLEHTEKNILKLYNA